MIIKENKGEGLQQRWLIRVGGKKRIFWVGTILRERSATASELCNLIAAMLSVAVQKQTAGLEQVSRTD
jgi:hypothetical protein